MFQVDWQEYEDIPEFSSEQYEELEKAVESYKDKMEYFWVKLSHDLMEHYNPDADTFAQVEENWKDNGGYEKQHEAMINSFGIDDSPIHCNVKMKPNHYVDEERGRIFGYTCLVCSHSDWDN